MAGADEKKWFEDYAEEADDLQIEEYDITAAPNDFNVLTIYSFIEAGSVKIPGFQRNYVWDIGRASKLIESLILGLPVPQVFLYEVGFAMEKTLDEIYQLHRDACLFVDGLLGVLLEFEAQ